MLKEYLEDITKTFKSGDATEASYYSALKKLLENYLTSEHQKPAITVEARKTKIGKPDFTIRNNKELIGHVEAKDLSLKDLSEVYDTEQIERYSNKLPNFILTNFLDFQLFRNGEIVQKVRIGQPDIIKKLKTPPPPCNQEEFFRLLNTFFSYNIPELKSAKTLAEELAQKAQLFPPYTIEELRDQETTEIDRIYDAFKKYLIPDLSIEDFADIYAQTITYGLFTARLKYQGKDFNRFIASEYIPQNIHIFRDTFSLISSYALPESITWIVDDIATILAHCDIEKIRNDLRLEKAGGDPIMHFYETFLAEYDPKKRKARGVYYTPLPVVSYITRSINIILKEKFNKKNGLADKSVTVLDPASGTLTFLANAILLVKEEVGKGKMAGAWQQIVKNHILKNFYAFELLMAPYIIGHLKISLLLEDLGYKFSKDDRFPLYLTNTLDLRDVTQAVDPYIAALSEEAIEAKKIKGKVPILVIMGNPPYSVSSANKSEFIEQEMNIYKEEVRNERNIQPLSDDYIKFIRFAHWKIDKAGQGVIGMITNNSYLSGLIHRGMRHKLLESFSEIYILNLHGNSRMGEKCSDGSKDENVFDIQQGVSIVLFVKYKEQKGAGKVFYQDVYGLREKKYEYLNKYDIDSTKWKRLESVEPHYFFVEKDFSYQVKYRKFLSVQEIFVQSSSGVKTHRDHFVVGFTQEEIKQRMRTFTSNLPDELVRQGLRLKDTSDFKLKEAREKLKKDDWKESILPYAYRPFDNRYICYRPELIDRDRYDVMKHFLAENIGLVFPRLSKGNFEHGFVTEYIADVALGGVHSGSETTIAPLYLYHKKDNPKKRFLSSQLMLFEPETGYGARKPNVSSMLIERLTREFKKTPSPEEIFYYVYAVLYSNIYRRQYQEFLKIDFPRIPFTKDYEVFKAMAKLGNELVDLHLLKSKKLEKSVAKFPASDGGKVEKREYKEKEDRIYINDKQYFSGVSKEVWNYYIGGYQVLDKWLKERQGKSLSDDDIAHFLKVITALSYTIELQKEIDKLYPKVEKVILREIY